MRYAIISDIHSNLEALEAVLTEIDRQDVDTVVCLGDIVGYNADPQACADRVLGVAAAVVRGNHDKAVTGLMDLDWFNSAARDAALWNRDAMQDATRARVRKLPQGPMALGTSILLCHGSPADEDEYLLPGAPLLEALRGLDERMPETRLCFHGHTHVPLAWSRDRNGRPPRREDLSRPVELDPDRVYLLNPGSVGQPRDGNSRASFGILDTGRGTFTYIRVAYAIRETQQKILAAGLPPVLARRLGEGR
jgi:predicted phosphodiesterase